METTTTELPVQTPASQPQASEAYETCDQCNSPVEANQRYCVVCGTHRKHVHDPAARFISSATSRSRTSTHMVRSARRPKRGPGLGTALILALIPLAVALGLLLGRSGNGQDAKLLAALRAQKPEVVNVGGGGTGAASAPSAPASAASLSSDFSLSRGYAVELGTISGSSSQSAAQAAEKADRAKGATAVGLINQSDFTVTPRPPSRDYVIYSGQYKTRGAAQTALAKLKKAFPKAAVISVVSTSGASQGAALNTTTYGTFHSVVGLKKPSKKQLNQGAAVTKQVASEINKNYVQSQKGLPNQISVP